MKKLLWIILIIALIIYAVVVHQWWVEGNDNMQHNTVQL